MAYYVGLFHLHGLKIVQSGNKGGATNRLTAGNRSVAPEWVERVHFSALDTVEHMIQLGWRGSITEFRLATSAKEPVRMEDLVRPE